MYVYKYKHKQVMRYKPKVIKRKNQFIENMILSNKNTINEYLVNIKRIL